MNTTIVSVSWLNKHWDDPDLIVLDASLNSNQSNLTTNYPNLQIKKARFVDLKNIFLDQRSTIPNSLPTPNLFAQNCQQLGINKNSKLVVYDNLGIYSSPRVWWMFKAMGHQEIAVLDGGLPAWIKQGYPTEIKKNTPVKKGDFAANYQANLIVNAATILENINTEKALVIDARTEERFNGLVSEARIHLRTGHIPKSSSLPFKNVLKNGHLKSKTSLQKLFQALPLDNRSLIASCGSGTTACILLLAYSHINPSNSLALYDGSWSEWGAIKDLPIEVQ